MQRRRFLGKLTMAGVGAAASISSMQAAVAKGHSGKAQVVKYAVKGFSCVTCAVGLETLLVQQSGVISAKADYKAATVAVEYIPDVIEEQKLTAAIEEMGFSAQRI